MYWKIEVSREERMMDTIEPEADEQDWASGALLSFAQDWDNPEDAIYDNWREHYHERFAD